MSERAPSGLEALGATRLRGGRSGILQEVATEQPRVLICDDAPGFRLLTQTVLEEAGFAIAGVAADWDEAEGLAASQSPDAILLDLWLPTFDKERIAAVRAAAPSALLAIVSSL